MKALRLENATVREIDIENKLEAFQEAVDGYIETVTLVPDEVVMIVNEEGRLRGMGINPYATCLYGEPIVGVAVVVGVDGEEFCDIPEEYAARLHRRFPNIEKELPEGSENKYIHQNNTTEKEKCQCQ